MNSYALYTMGFFAQSLFGARLVAQWIHSERAGKVVSPTIFWVLSIAGSSIFLLYGAIREDAVILIGQTIAFYIYIRNLQLKGVWKSIYFLIRILLLCLPPLLMVWFFSFGNYSIDSLLKKNSITDVYMVVGVIGQLMLNFRYFYQWYFSEKARESVLPLGFWVISAVASFFVIGYAWHRIEPVLLVAQSIGLIAYLRNIYFHFKTR